MPVINPNAPYQDSFHKPLDDEQEKLGNKVVNAAYQVYKELGPGLLEKVYEACFCYELRKAGIQFVRQAKVPIVYDSLEFDEGLRLDVLIEDSIIVEIKSVENSHPVWEAQIISYLKLTENRLGFLINFNVPYFKRGIKRIIV